MSASTLQVLFGLTGTKIFNAECFVRPPSRFRATAADDATAKTLFNFNLRKHGMAVISKVFSVPPKAL